MVEQGRDWVSRNQAGLVSGVWGVLSTTGTVLAGLALVLFLLIFFVYDGERLWRGLLRPLPQPNRERAVEAGARAFHDLTAYVRTTMIVAFIDAVGIGIGLWVTGVPLVLPLAGLVFLGAFVPVIGAFVTGIVAVLVALVSKGLVVALIVAGVVIAVQQLEGNVFEPLLMSRAVSLHPVAVILGVAIGAELAGRGRRAAGGAGDDDRARRDPAAAYCRYPSTTFVGLTSASSGFSPAARRARRWRSRSQQRSSSTSTALSRCGSG